MCSEKHYIEEINDYIYRLIVSNLDAPESVAEAREKTISSLKANPKQGTKWYLLGNIYYIEESFAESEMCFNNCIKLDPSVPEYRQSLAFALRQQGKYEQSDNILFGPGGA